MSTGAGKGDSPRYNLKKFSANYEGIDFGHGKKDPMDKIKAELKESMSSLIGSGPITKETMKVVEAAWAKALDSLSMPSEFFAFPVARDKIEVVMQAKGRSVSWIMLLACAAHPDCKHEALSIDVGPSQDHGGGVTLHTIEVTEGHRGRGIGSKAIRAITFLADHFGVSIDLEASDKDERGVVKWYMRHGFVFHDSGSYMVRYPSCPTCGRKKDMLMHSNGRWYCHATHRRD